MSYAKPTKKCVDAPLGFRTVNELAGNQDDTAELLSLEHVRPPEGPQGPGSGTLSGKGTGFANSPGNSATSGGAHDTPKVARGELSAELDELFAVGSRQLFIALQTGVCAGLVRLGVGVYFLPVVGLSSFDAQVFPIHDEEDTAARLVQHTVSSEDRAPGLFVSLWREATLLSSSIGFSLYDFGFHAVVYGYREESPATASSLAVARRPSLAAMPFRRGPFGRRSGR